MTLPFTPIPTASYAWIGSDVYTMPYRYDAVPGRCSIAGDQVASTVKALGLTIVAGAVPTPLLLPAVCATTLATSNARTASTAWSPAMQPLERAKRVVLIHKEGPAFVQPDGPLEVLKSPYPYFGGKSTVASVVWERFGDVANYVEPFLGSAAMLLARPVSHLQKPRIETVNDKDGFISNFWRAVQADPVAVARYADWPVIENDLHARHLWLVDRRDSLTECLEGNPDYFDAKIAGWWVWGMSSWLGSGFCSGAGPWRAVDGRLVKDNTGAGVVGQLPRLTGEQGVHRKRPHLMSSKGIKRQRPHLLDEGRGVVRQVPHLAHDEQGIHGVTRKMPEIVSRRGEPRDDYGVSRQLPELKSARGGHRALSNDLDGYMTALQRRLRRVRVCSGDWTRVIGPGVTVSNGLTGVFLDPPYIHGGRDTTVYTHDEQDIAHKVRQWAIENGDNPLLRIAYCGYEDGQEWPASWSAHRWKANGGYGNQGQGQGRDNARREVIWFSPHCLKVERSAQPALFAMAGD